PLLHPPSAPTTIHTLSLHDALPISESKLERALVDHLQEFLLEMCRGFCFVARQRRVTFDNEHYWIDLLLYNRRLQCLVALDLILDRKSTRLNSSHVKISYAVFCLKK